MENISISKEAIKTIINYYTKESGVRELERILESLVRKIIVEDEFNKRSVYFIDNDNITSYLGNYKYNVDDSLENNTSGVVNTLAYTPYGVTFFYIYLSVFFRKTADFIYFFISRRESVFVQKLSRHTPSKGFRIAVRSGKNTVYQTFFI